MMKILSTALVCTLAAITFVGHASTSLDTPAQAVTVKLIGINDFHGRLKVDPDDKTATVPVLDESTGKVVDVYAGGAAYLATLIKQLRGTTPYSTVVAAGDIIGASQPIVSLTSEEAAIDVMSEIGLEVTSVGNHEFDKGKDELMRMQQGGCKPAPLGGRPGENTCIANPQSRSDGKFAGAKFQYLAANMVDTATQAPVLPATVTKKFGAVTVGYVGLALKDAPSATSGAAGLSFFDEVPVINQKAAELKKNGADAIVVLIHQGGQYPQANYINYQPNDVANQCGRGTEGYNGFEDIGPIVEGLKNVDVVISGHTHNEYVCPNFRGTGVLLTSAGFYGRLVTDINLKIVPGKGVIEKSAATLPVINELNQTNNVTVPKGFKVLTPDPETQRIIDAYDRITNSRLQVLQGYVQEKISNCDRALPGWETPLGNLVADAFLDAYNEANPENRADVAFANSGGLRASIPYIEPDGRVTYGAIYTVLPFGNDLVYKMMSGAELLRLLEQQWEAPLCQRDIIQLPSGTICGRLLQPSRSIRYTWDYSKGQGRATGMGALLVPGSVKINEVALDHTKSYRVIISKFHAEGGDGFDVFKGGAPFVKWGGSDLAALQVYFDKTLLPGAAKISKPSSRLTCLNCPAGIDTLMNDPASGVCVKY